MRVKIRGGTVNGGEPPLCQTCRYATIVRGPSLRDEIVECQELMFRRGVALPAARKLLEGDVQDRVLAPAVEVEVPPFGFVDREPFGFHHLRRSSRCQRWREVRPG